MPAWAFFPDSTRLGHIMTRRIVPILFFAFSVLPGFGADEPISKVEMNHRIRNWLLDLHGGSTRIPAYALRLDQSGASPLESMKELLLEIASDKNYDLFGRQNAACVFTMLEPEDRQNRLEPLYLEPNGGFRAALQYSALQALPDLPSKLAYTRKRLDWLSDHPHFQKDAYVFDGYFQTTLLYGRPTPEERNAILSFYRKEAAEASFGLSAYEAELLLRSFDPAWSTSEVRRIMMEKWKDDPSVYENMRMQWTETLASFDSASADSSGEEEPSPSPAAPSASAGAEAGGAPSEAPRPSEPDTTAAREPRPDSRAGWKTLAFGIACFGLLLVLSWIIRRFRRNSRHD